MPKIEFVSVYKGYKIFRRLGIKRRPFRVQVPGRPGRFADKKSLPAAHKFIDVCLSRLENQDGTS